MLAKNVKKKTKQRARRMEALGQSMNHAFFVLCSQTNTVSDLKQSSSEETANQ